MATVAVETCINGCGKQATWIRHTQFAGTHPFCTECAKKEKDFGEDSSYVGWECLSMNYVTWAQQMADRRKVCLACEFDEWAAQATAEDLAATQPCAFPHGGQYCRVPPVEEHMTVEDAVKKLEQIFRDLQDNDETNDKWDWMGADFCIHVIKSHLKLP